MADPRPFPPSPRRRALAQQAGLHAASPWLVAAIAAAASLAAVAGTAGTLGRQLGEALAAACRGTATLEAQALTRTVSEAALPVLLAAALGAIAAHVAQTRALWLPRRRIAGAPAIADDAPARAARAVGDIVAGATVAAVALAWLWWAAPRLAALISSPARGEALAAAAALLLHLGGAIVASWAVLGALDAVVRHARRARALAMTATEKRQDDRLAAADPRWRRRRDAIHRELSVRDAVAGATVLVLGDDLAVAVAWDPIRRPIPTRTAAGRGARATQLLALARRHRVPVHREPALASALAASEGAIPEPIWPRLAEIVAAVGGRGLKPR